MDRVISELLDRTVGNPELDPLVRRLFLDNERLLAPMATLLGEVGCEDYLAELATLWSAMRAMDPGSRDQRIARAVEGLQYHSIEFLRRQVRFACTGRYMARSAAAVYESVYTDPETMQRYLDGLLLTYVAWPNHFRMLQWYRKHYLAQGSPGRCLEIGPGHGWLAFHQLNSSPANTLLGLDISPHSILYARRLLAASGVSPARFEMREIDATTPLSGSGECGPFDRIVIAEVIEHVENPLALLQSAVARARPGATVFVSTVVNIEAVDHLYLFRSLEEVRTLLGRCGLRVIAELDLPLEMSGASDCFEVAVICEPE